jgi:large subunit ribosomal protein L23
MSKKSIIIKPVLTEKSEKLSQKLNQHVFVVRKDANKFEIRGAVEKMFNVKVEAVNTSTLPGKFKKRFSRRGVAKGQQPSYKKAIVTVKEGETLDIYDSE